MAAPGARRAAEWDVLIAGGGPAGLSAALMLGRCRRRVLVCDAGPKRNQATRALHGFLSRDGMAPAALLREARAQLRAYPAVRLRRARVLALRPRDGRFEARLSDGRAVTTRRVLLATGVVDDLPPWRGLRRYYGRSVFHCPYCDAWEFRDRRLAAWGLTAAAAGLALKLTRWSRRVTLLTGGAYRLPPRVRRKLATEGVVVREERVTGLAGRAGLLGRVRFASGTPLPCDALFLTVGQQQACPLFARLRCRFSNGGAVAADRRGRTSVPGVFAAGDASIDTQLVVVAASEGARAAVAINEELLAEDLSSAK